LEDDLNEIRKTLRVSDARNVGSLLGATLLGVLGLVLFSWSVPFAAVGGVAGFALGRLLGWKMRRRQTASQPLNQNEMYQLRLACLLIWLKQHKARKENTVESLAEAIEIAVNELRPCFALQLNNKRFRELIKEFEKVLKADVCHAAILNRLAEVESLMYQKTHSCVIVNRLRNVFIPLMLLLERPPEKP
jgi:hypothetical protein